MNFWEFEKYFIFLFRKYIRLCVRIYIFLGGLEVIFLFKFINIRSLCIDVRCFFKKFFFIKDKSKFLILGIMMCFKIFWSYLGIKRKIKLIYFLKDIRISNYKLMKKWKINNG